MSYFVIDSWTGRTCVTRMAYKEILQSLEPRGSGKPLRDPTMALGFDSDLNPVLFENGRYLIIRGEIVVPQAEEKEIVREIVTKWELCERWEVE